MLTLEGKARSSIKGAWSDSYHHKAVPMLLSAEYIRGLLARRAPIIKRVGKTQTVRAIEWRGDATLFDACTMRDSKIDNGCPRGQIRGAAYRTEVPVQDEATHHPWLNLPDALTLKSRLSHVQRSIQYHQLNGILPAFKVVERKPTPLKIEADAAVLAWHTALQLAHLEVLGVEL